jgi:hypothetical protein
MPAPRHDLTQGPISKTLLLFALPTLGSNILQSLNGSINSIWVGRFLGEQALAATSNANIIMFLMFSAVFGFGMAATILIGQSMGRHDVEAARRAFGSAHRPGDDWRGADRDPRLVASHRRSSICSPRPARRRRWRWPICASSSSACPSRCSAC